MSLFGTSVNSGGFGFGGPAATATSGFGPSGGSSFDPVPSAASGRGAGGFADADDASEPFGRVENTLQCFERNGKAATTFKWTPPRPPASRPLFQTSPPPWGSPFQSSPPPSSGFHGGGGDSKPDFPAFGYSSQPQSKPLFGSSAPAFAGSQVTVSGGGFAFGATAASTSATDTNAGPGFGGTGGSLGQAKSTSLFGSTGSSDVGPCFGVSGAVFGSSSSAAKPPLAPSPNPFTSSTSGFATKSTTSSFSGSAQPTNPFAASTTTQFGVSKAFSFGDSTAKQSSGAPNSFALKNASSSMSNPFATKQTLDSTSNPFAMTQIPSSSANPFASPAFASSSSAGPLAARVSPNANVNPFSVPTSDSSSSNKNPFAAPSPSWPSAQTLWPATSANPGSASMKFKSGLRPAFHPSASLWSTSTKESSSAQPASIPCFDWTGWEKKKEESTQQNAAILFNTPNLSSVEATKNSPSSVVPASEASSSSDVLVASPDTNPYGSGSFGAGLVEQKIKTAIANPPASVELKILDARSSSASIAPMPRQQPSARFAAKLGLARQPLQAVPMRPVHPRFPSRRARTTVSASRSQVDPFRFSSSFSRLAISKRALTVQVDPTAMAKQNDLSSPGKAEPVGSAHERAEVTSPVKSNEKSDDEPEAAATLESDTEDEEQVDKPTSSSAWPGLRSDEYFTQPSVGELQQLTDEELARVENFVIGRRGCGKISFVGATDLRGLQLDDVVVFSDGEVVVYPDERAKPDVGCALNKPAIVDLHGISAELNESHEDFLKRLERHTQALGATFLGYDEDLHDGSGGVWSFRVEHF